MKRRGLWDASGENRTTDVQYAILKQERPKLIMGEDSKFAVPSK